MADTADVRSVEAIRDLRAALLRYGEDARIALSDVDFDIRKTVDYVANDQRLHWQGEIRRWEQKLAQAKAELHRKKLAKFMDRRPDTSQEEKAVRRAEERLEEAHRKFKRIQQLLPELHHAIDEYRGQAQPLADQLEREVPRAVARLDRMSAALEGYAAIAPPSALPRTGPTVESAQRHAQAPAVAASGTEAEVPPGQDEPTQTDDDHERRGGLEPAEPRPQDPAGEVRPDGGGLA